MIWSIAEIVAGLIECFLITNFLVRFLDYKKKKNILLKFTTGFALISLDSLVVPFLFDAEIISGILLLVICFVYSVVFLKENICVKIFAVFLSNLIILIINSLVLTGFSRIYDTNFVELISSRNLIRLEILLITKFLYFLISQIILSVCRKKKYELNKTEWTAVVTIFLTTISGAIAVFEIMLKPEYSDISCAVLIAGLVLINVAAYFFMIKNSRDNREKTRSDLLMIQLSEQKIRIEEIDKMYGEILQIRHDIKKCVGCAGILIQQGYYQDAVTYLESISSEKIGAVKEYVILENRVVSSVVNSKLSQCRKENIEITVSVADCLKWFPETDISILIANLFDNAIEACRKVKMKKQISFTAEQYMGYAKILLKNTADESEMKNHSHKTTKLDKKNHGYGIKTIKELTEKYDGICDFCYDNGEFTADVWLKIPD